MTQLRGALLSTLADLRNRETPMEPDRARAIAQVAGVLVDSAKVEIEYLKAIGTGNSQFLEQQPTPQLGAPSESGYTQGTVQRLAGVTRHTLKG
jgi:hypothetical protein